MTLMPQMSPSPKEGRVEGVMTGAMKGAMAIMLMSPQPLMTMTMMTRQVIH